MRGGMVSAATKMSPVVRVVAVTAPSAYPASDAGDASFGRTGRENRTGLHVVGHEGVYGDRHRAAQGRLCVEDAVGGREDRRRGVGCGGLTLFRAAENGFVDRSCGDAGRQIAARTD